MTTLTRMVIPTDDSHRFYLLLPVRAAVAAECDGCCRQTRNGYTLLYIDMRERRTDIRGWCCSTDCAVNTAAAGE